MIALASILYEGIKHSFPLPPRPAADFCRGKKDVLRLFVGKKDFSMKSLEEGSIGGSS